MSLYRSLMLTIGLSVVALSSMSRSMAVEGSMSIDHGNLAGIALQGRGIDGPDYDRDGIRNQDDLDDDNDGIPDSAEGGVDNDGNGYPDVDSVDTDGDGTPDLLDLDSDNDGILDNMEARLSRDAVMAMDQVTDGSIDINFPVGRNGVTDEIETSPDSGLLLFTQPDTDHDGTPDFRDLDSDNDGIYDVIEAGSVDTDRDGRLDNFYDADDKGVDDKVQASALPLFDTDGDGTLDFRDLDSDADGIPDRVENRGTASLPTDTDGDGAADYREQDSDNDGVSDALEAGPDAEHPVDTNGDGIPDFQDPSVQYNDGTGPVDPQGPGSGDHDGDGEPDAVDTDDDNDGIPDLSDGSLDSDNDGVIDRLDRDSDNDGVLDSRETGRDTDGDGVPDFRDLDSDNDGLFDSLEAGRSGVTAHGRLSSAASVDTFGLADGASDLVRDTDGDGIADLRDLDSDNDGLPDVQETGHLDADHDAHLDDFTDGNGDGLSDALPAGSGTLRDTDGDRLADVQDLDSDQDGLSDLLENGGGDSDQDNDGRIDNFVDANGDGLDDTQAANLGALTDTDQDGIPDFQDLDSDGDGISDLLESGGSDADVDGRHDLLADSDGDGIPDLNDVDMTGGNDVDNDGIDDSMDSDVVSGADTDGDGIIDEVDPDADGNGFAGPFDDEQSGPSQGGALDLPDRDGDGVPDYQQDDPADGRVETGLSGSGFGCSIATVGLASGIDPVLPVLLAGCALLLALRGRRSRESDSRS
ncbi:MAG: hypothetical protein HKN42_19655 [Granulosicoccus sp.]|nr:hypothetical protein [Granulosicoccus sp.]